MERGHEARSSEELEQEIAELKRELEERKATEAALRRREQHYRNFFETGLVGMAATSTDRRWLDVNDTLCEMLGYSREELLQKTWAELTHPDDVGMNQADVELVLAGKQEGFTAEKRYRRKDGRYIHAILRTRGLRRPDGSVEYFISFLQDVTDRAQAVQELTAHVATIEAQNRAIRELSLPIIEVWEGVLAVPVVGGLDRERAAEMMGRLLERISSSGAHRVVVDLTGVEDMDADSASHLQRILAAAKLLGVTSLVTGIRPRVAQTMVASGIDFSSVSTRRSLKDALRRSLRNPQGDSQDAG